MERTEIKTALEKYLREIPNEFTLEIVEENGVIVRLSSEDDFAQKRIGCWLKNGMELTNYNAYITIKPVETIIQPILIKHSIIGKGNKELQTTTSLFQSDPEFYQKFSSERKAYRVEKERDIEKMGEDISFFVQSYCLPFFERWQDLKSVCKIIEIVPNDKLNLLLGNGAVFKKLILYRFCEHPNFQEYFKWLYEGFVEGWKRNPKRDILFKHHADVLIDLMPLLEITKD